MAPFVIKKKNTVFSFPCILDFVYSLEADRVEKFWIEINFKIFLSGRIVRVLKLPKLKFFSFYKML